MDFFLKLPKKGTNSRLNNSIKKLKYIPTILITGFLTGCSVFNIGESEYSCKGMPEVNGMQCMSAREVYAATNNGVVPNSTNPNNTNQVQTVSTQAVDPVISQYVTPNLPDKPIPIRTPANVMRVWVAPWEDESGNLIISGHIYTEVEKRRWVLGESAPKTNISLNPLRSINRKN